MNSAKPSFAVLGSGSWGTALASLIARNGHPTTIWGRDADQVGAIARTHENPRYLPGIALPESLQASTDIAATVAGRNLDLPQLGQLALGLAMGAVHQGAGQLGRAVLGGALGHVEQDPVDQRYWRNLARVDEQIMLAKAAPSAGGGPGIVPAAGSPSPALAETTSAAQPASVRRVQAATLRTARARETFITTAVGDAGTSVSSPLSVTRRMAARPAGITVEGRPGSARYPVRIELSSPNKPAVALRRSGDRKAYPIRVALDAQ